MKIKVLCATRVNLPANTEVEVTEMEAKRLLSLGFACEVKAVKKAEPVQEVEEKAPAKKKAKK